MTVPTKVLSDGVKIPVLGFGTWLLEGKKCTEAVTIALKVGYRHIDTAFAYYNQEFIKEAIRDFPRQELFITTKLWRDHLYPDKVEYECDLNLMQLGVDYVDLYLIHWPDSHKPLDNILNEMHRLKKKGKIRSVGVSNFTINHLEKLLKQKIDISVNQIEYHPYLNQNALRLFCNQNGIAVTAYSPIAHGKVFKDPILIDLGKKYNKSAGQISLRWLLQKDMIVIPKASSHSHIEEDYHIFDFVLSKEDMDRIDQLQGKKGERIIKPEFHEFDE